MRHVSKDQRGFLSTRKTPIATRPAVSLRPSLSRKPIQKQDYKEKVEEDSEHQNDIFVELGRSRVGPAPKNEWWMKYITVLNFVGIIALAIAFAVSATTSGSPTSVSSTRAVRQMSNSLQVQYFDFPFTLVPTSTDRTGRYMTVPLKHAGIQLETLFMYMVCCRTSERIVCGGGGATTKKDDLFISAYLTTDNMLFVIIHHSDMIGSICRLSWTQKTQATAIQELTKSA